MNEEGPVETAAVENALVESSTPKWLATFLAIYLICTFLWRAFVPAHEFPSIALRNFSIGLDIFCVVCLVALRIERFRRRSPASLGANVLFVLALLGGLGLFAIRNNGTESFWTGHVKYDLLPRSSSEYTPDRASRPSAANSVAKDPKTESSAAPPAANDSPTDVYKAFYAASKNNDRETMITLIERGEFRMLDFTDKTKANARNDQTIKRVLQRPLGSSDDTRNEKITGNTATIECLGSKGQWFTRTLVIEDGKWKLRN